LLAVLNLVPTPRVAQSGADVADDCLTSSVDMNVLNARSLLATATQLRAATSRKR